MILRTRDFYPPDVVPIPVEGQILMGLTGSRAYGLDTSESDYDWKGIYQAPTCDILGLMQPKETIVRSSPHPDLQVHELGKFLQLALKCNPTVMEMLWLDEYVLLANTGAALVANRELFLWSKPIQNGIFGRATQMLKQVRSGNVPEDEKEGVLESYINYAKDQFRRIADRDGTYKSKLAKRTAKHTRHLFRLLDQGEELLTTGQLTVKVKDPQRLFDLGNLPLAEMVPFAEAEIARFKKIKSILPAQPRKDEVSDLLIKLRLKEIQA